MIHAMSTTFMFSVQYFSSFLHMWDNATKNYIREEPAEFQGGNLH